uniref:Uncharacterized protein n=1 Tax=Salix viminalis TaxID=40686 RepID=A0A6N2MGB3_SALVM
MWEFLWHGLHILAPACEGNFGSCTAGGGYKQSQASTSVITGWQDAHLLRNNGWLSAPLNSPGFAQLVMFSRHNLVCHEQLVNSSLMMCTDSHFEQLGETQLALHESRNTKYKSPITTEPEIKTTKKELPTCNRCLYCRSSRQIFSIAITRRRNKSPVRR